MFSDDVFADRSFRRLCVDFYIITGLDLKEELDKQMKEAYASGYEKGREDALIGGGV